MSVVYLCHTQIVSCKEGQEVQEPQIQARTSTAPGAVAASAAPAGGKVAAPEAIAAAAAGNRSTIETFCKVS